MFVYKGLIDLLDHRKDTLVLTVDHNPCMTTAGRDQTSRPEQAVSNPISHQRLIVEHRVEVEAREPTELAALFILAEVYLERELGETRLLQSVIAKMMKGADTPLEAQTDAPHLLATNIELSRNVFLRFWIAPHESQVLRRELKLKGQELVRREDAR